MGKIRTVMFFVLAVFFGLVASRQISKYIESRIQREQNAADTANIVLTQDVVVASAEIPWGTRLTSEQLKVIPWPKDYVPESAFFETELLVGRAAKVGLVQDELILEPKLVPEGFKGGMTGIIPDGKRAITIKVNEVAGVAGFVTAGSKVDIILTVEIPFAYEDEIPTLLQRKKSEKGKKKEEDSGISVSRVLLENMLVLAIDQKMSQDESMPVIVNAVTLLATPEEAEELTLAGAKGRLQLAMRNGMDAVAVNTTGAFFTSGLIGITKNEILSVFSGLTGIGTKARNEVDLEVACAAPEPTLTSFEVEVINGTLRSHVTFDDIPLPLVTDTKESFEM